MQITSVDVHTTQFSCSLDVDQAKRVLARSVNGSFSQSVVEYLLINRRRH